jgi:hypothetical protein
MEFPIDNTLGFCCYALLPSCPYQLLLEPMTALAEIAAAGWRSAGTSHVKYCVTYNGHDKYFVKKIYSMF